MTFGFKHMFFLLLSPAIFNTTTVEMLSLRYALYFCIYRGLTNCTIFHCSNKGLGKFGYVEITYRQAMFPVCLKYMQLLKFHDIPQILCMTILTGRSFLFVCILKIHQNWQNTIFDFILLLFQLKKCANFFCHGNTNCTAHKTVTIK